MPRKPGGSVSQQEKKISRSAKKKESSCSSSGESKSTTSFEYQNNHNKQTPSKPTKSDKHVLEAGIDKKHGLNVEKTLKAIPNSGNNTITTNKSAERKKQSSPIKSTKNNIQNKPNIDANQSKTQQPRESQTKNTISHDKSRTSKYKSNQKTGNANRSESRDKEKNRQQVSSSSGEESYSESDSEGSNSSSTNSNSSSSNSETNNNSEDENTPDDRKNKKTKPSKTDQNLSMTESNKQNLKEDKLIKELPSELDTLLTKVDQALNIKKDGTVKIKKSKIDSKQDNQKLAISNLKAKEDAKVPEINNKKKSDDKNVRRKSNILSTSKSRSPIQPKRRRKSLSRNRDKSLQATKIYIGKLTRNICRNHIYEIFSIYGRIKSVDFPFDRISCINLGHAYVDYIHHDSVAEAIDFMDNAYLDGQLITVQKTLPMRKTGFGIAGINMRGRRSFGFRRTPSPFASERINQRIPERFNRQRYFNRAIHSRSRSRSPQKHPQSKMYGRNQTNTPSPSRIRKDRSRSPARFRRERSRSRLDRERYKRSHSKSSPGRPLPYTLPRRYKRRSKSSSSTDSSSGSSVNEKSATKQDTK